MRVWWPLAASWMLMGVEGPLISAVIARLAEAEVQLAAWGGVVFPLSLVIEAPVVMLLAASTALSKDWQSYRRLRAFTYGLSGAVTLIHLLIVLTPLYHVVVEGVLGTPPEIVAPARIGLLLMTPWTWAIAVRRFNQGVLIRFGRSLSVGAGTLVRLGADVVVLGVGYAIGSVAGVAVAAMAIVSGVLAEAAYVRWKVGPVLRTKLGVSRGVVRLGWGQLVRFYWPLAVTSVIQLAGQPVSAAAVGRMPHPVVSLAAWQVATALFFLLRSPGWAYSEVVVSLLEESQARSALRRFTVVLSVGSTMALLVLLIPPVGSFYFERVNGLTPALAATARGALWLALPLPAFAVVESYFQGVVVHGRRTRASTEAILLFLLAQVALLVVGVLWGGVTGVYVATLAFGAGELARALWLWWRSRSVWRVAPA